MNIRPKTFMAAVNFSCAGRRFRAGDVVPPSLALASALRYGDRFVTVLRRPRPHVPPPVLVVVSTPTDQPTDGDVDNTPLEE